MPRHSGSNPKTYPSPKKPSQSFSLFAPELKKPRPNKTPAPNEQTTSPARTVRESTDFEVERIAQRIRDWREEIGLTLLELARRSTVAASTIHKVETGQMVPTIAVLLKISRGLDRPATDLVQDSTHEFLVSHLTAADRQRIGEGSPMVLERLCGDLFQPDLEAWRIHLEPGQGSGTNRFRFDGEVLIRGEKGELTVSIGDQEYLVKEDDTLHYKTNLPHSWRNDRLEPLQFAITGSRPRILRAALNDQLRNGHS